MSLPDMKKGISPIKPIRFIGVCIMSFVLIVWLPESVFAPLNQATAHLAGLCLALFGEHPETAGNIISLHGFPVRIITECTALYSMVLFGAFLFSAQASLKARVVGLLFGGSFLTVANIFRIALITMTGAKYPNLFEIFHIYLGQIVMMLLVIGSSLAWLRWSAGSADSFRFIISVAVLVSLLFIPWLVVNRLYVAALDSVVRFIFSLFGYAVTTPRPLAVYNHTFAVPLIFSLIMALHDLPFRRRLNYMGAGILIIACWHILFRVSHVLWTAFAINQFESILQFIYILGQYLLPILFWLAAMRGISFRGKSGMAKGTQLLTLLALLLILARPSAARADLAVTVQPSGVNTLTLSAIGMQSISQGEILVQYQVPDQSVPIVSAVGFGAQAGLQAAVNSQGTIVLSFSSKRPISGDGMLATIMLAAGGQILSVSAQFKNVMGAQIYAATSITNLNGNEQQPPDPSIAARLREKERKQAREEAAAEASRQEETAPSPGVPVSAPVVSTPAPSRPDVSAGPLIPNGKGVLPFHCLESVLDRLRAYAGTRSSAAFARLFTPVADARFSQMPAVLIADGAASLLLKFSQAEDGETVNLFLIEGAQCTALHRGEPGEWILELIPERGRVEASVTVQTNLETVEYPLTVSPALTDFLIGENDASRPYLLDYVKTANEIAERSATAERFFRSCRR
jgi:exosortase H (IPTLxxWG-CTERM-specific)